MNWHAPWQRLHARFAERTPAGGGPRITRLSVLAAHLTWVFLGPVALVALAYGIVVAGTGWVTALDAGFVAAVAWILLARWYEQRSGEATTLEGRPATWEDFRRYAVRLVIVAAAVWVAANVVGNHLLPSAEVVEAVQEDSLLGLWGPSAG